MDEDQVAHAGLDETSQQNYDVIEEEQQRQQLEETVIERQEHAGTVSVSQLQPTGRDPRFGAAPIYAQEAQARQQQNRQAYTGDEEQVICGRFPHVDFCACDVDCQEAIRDISLFEVFSGIYMGPFQSAFKTGELIESGVTHILNVTCKAYTKRDRYFKYLDLHLYDEPQENAKKYFRITNRFINEALNSGGRVLIHSIEGKSRCATFILAYLISTEGVKLKDGLQMLRQYVGEVEPNEGFMQQLAQYDLELLQINE